MKKIFIIFILIIWILYPSEASYANDGISSSSNQNRTEIQNGVVGKWYPCGHTFRFMILYQPVMTKSQSYQTADGIFILFRVLVANDSENPISGLKNDSFILSKESNGKTYDFTLSGGHSRTTSKAWEIDTLQDELLGLSQKDTYLVFDVDGNINDSWVLTFSPVERGQERNICTIKISLPQISYENN